MSRRKKIVITIIAIAAIAVAILFANPCRDPDPPDHPVPAITKASSLTM